MQRYSAQVDPFCSLDRPVAENLKKIWSVSRISHPLSIFFFISLALSLFSFDQISIFISLTSHVISPLILPEVRVSTTLPFWSTQDSALLSSWLLRSLFLTEFNVSQETFAIPSNHAGMEWTEGSEPMHLNKFKKGCCLHFVPGRNNSFSREYALRNGREHFLEPLGRLDKLGSHCCEYDRVPQLKIFRLISMCRYVRLTEDDPIITLTQPIFTNSNQPVY